jgi:hypothetical protein
MGLHMHLYVYTYTKLFKDIEDEDNIVEVKQKFKKKSLINPERIRFVTEEVGYWSSSYHIHRWFVENVQKGIDNYARYKVEEEELYELLKLCKKTLKNPTKAKILLPHINNLYDEEYFEEIKKTISIIKNLISELSKNKHFFKFIYYHSSY